MMLVEALPMRTPLIVGGGQPSVNGDDGVRGRRSSLWRRRSETVALWIGVRTGALQVAQ